MRPLRNRRRTGGALRRGGASASEPGSETGHQTIVGRRNVAEPTTIEGPRQVHELRRAVERPTRCLVIWRQYVAARRPRHDEFVLIRAVFVRPLQCDGASRRATERSEARRRLRGSGGPSCSALHLPSAQLESPMRRALPVLVLVAAALAACATPGPTTPPSPTPGTPGNTCLRGTPRCDDGCFAMASLASAHGP